MIKLLKPKQQADGTISWVISEFGLAFYYKCINGDCSIKERSKVLKFIKIHHIGSFLVNFLISNMDTNEYLKIIITKTTWKPF